MNSLFWARAHGALTHFPIALIFAVAFFEILGFISRQSERRRTFHAVGYWLIILAGAGSVAAAISGLGLSHWKVAGTGLLFWHHVFVWPALALILILAVWRVAAGDRLSHRGFSFYLALTLVACALVGAAGFVGG